MSNIDIAEKLTSIKNSIKPKVTLIAVSKTMPVDIINKAIQAGQIDFGENYVQEAINKIQYFSRHNNNLNWHFIGSIQSNKTKDIATNFDWVHTIENSKIASRLNAQRPFNLPKLQVCIQVNIDNSTTKSGIKNYAEILDLAQYIHELNNIELRGLMCIPDGIANINAFASIHNIYMNLQKIYASIDTLCMGMSADYLQAIEYGSNMVRIGTGIFGARS
jgi:PLP dependent protein